MKKRSIRNLLPILMAVFLVFSFMPFYKGKVFAANLTWPVPGHTQLSQGFHDGCAIDISDKNIGGANIVAAYGGTVTNKFTCGSQHYGSMHTCQGFGTGLVIKGDDGRFYQYAHMQSGSIPGNIVVGSRVNQGQLIGRVGTTGNSSGYHLHFGISYGTYYSRNGVDPSKENYSTNRPPEGSFDLCAGGPGTVRVAGWAKDPDTSAAIQVHVYIGGEGHVIMANMNRSDVGKHAFDYIIDTKKTGTQQVDVYAIDSAGGVNNKLGSATVNIASPNPTGVVDVIQGKCGAVYVRGWAFDPNDMSKQLDIHVYVETDASAGGGSEGHVIKANKKREDVHKVYSCGKKHGFDETFETKKTGKQTIYVYAINVGAGSNQLIGKKTVNISSPNPTGVVDVVNDKGGSILVKGWAFDPNDTSKQINVHVYIGDPANGGELHSITANKKREDVDKVYGCGKNHGFLETIKTKKTGTQKVYFYGINVGYGKNTLLGSKTVNITKAVTNTTTRTAAKPATSAAGKTVAKPPVTSIKKLKKAKKAFVVKWKKCTQNVMGYQIQYSTSKSFKKNSKTVTVRKNITTSKKIKRLKAKKKYYVRVRTYRIANGKSICSAWSRTKSVRTK